MDDWNVRVSGERGELKLEHWKHPEATNTDLVLGYYVATELAQVSREHLSKIGALHRYHGVSKFLCDQTHRLVLMSAGNYCCMCLVSLCIQDAPLSIWLVLTHFLFSR